MAGRSSGKTGRLFLRIQWRAKASTSAGFRSSPQIQTLLRAGDRSGISSVEMLLNNGGVDSGQAADARVRLQKVFEVQAPVGEFDTADRLAGKCPIVRNHENGVPGIGQLAKIAAR